jgi:hypothetical protein
MLELYVRCPATGEPVFVGFPPSLNGPVAPGLLMKNATCPVCGVVHDWQAAAVWSEIPVTLPSPVDFASVPDAKPAYEAPSEPPPLRNVA